MRRTIQPPPVQSALARPGRRPPGSTVVKRATVKFAADVVGEPPESAPVGASGPASGLSGPVAPASDRLGELLRMYSELSGERKLRAFDYIQQLHKLETEGPGGMDNQGGGSGFGMAAATSSWGRGRRVASPPPPSSAQLSFDRPGFGRPRPAPVQVSPHMGGYEAVERMEPPPPAPVVNTMPYSAQPAMMVPQPPPQPNAPPPVELRLTLTGDQVRRLGETMSGGGGGGGGGGGV